MFRDDLRLTGRVSSENISKRKSQFTYRMVPEHLFRGERSV